MYWAVGWCMPILRIAVLVIILIAGLWPFNPIPHNDVRWLSGANGLQFGMHGIVSTDTALPIQGAGSGNGCTLELWLVPDSGDDNNTFLAIATAEQPERFRMAQYGDEVLFQREILRKGQDARVAEIEVAHVFHADQPVYLAIAGDESGTTAYVDGRIAGKSARFGMTRADLEGRIYFGTATTRFATWQGTLKGIRITGRKLNEREIQANSAAGVAARGAPAIPGEVGAYWFREGQGSIAKADLPENPELTIPKYFTIPWKPLLTPPWKEFRASRGYVADIVLNVAGFMPLGFVFLPLFSKRFGERGSILKIILLGFAVSLLIELLQAWIPSRTSGMTDLITNTAGTYLGALVCSWGPVQGVLRESGEVRSSPSK